MAVKCFESTAFAALFAIAFKKKVDDTLSFSNLQITKKNG